MGKERCIQGFGWGNLRERDHLGDPGVAWKTILKRIFREGNLECMDWIELAQDRERWRALMSVVMNLRVP